MPNQLRALRILAAAMMAALVVIGIVLAFVVHGGDRRAEDGSVVHTHTPSAWLYVVIVGLGLLAAGLIATVGYRVRALPPDQDPDRHRGAVLDAYRRSMFVRVAFSEAVAIIAIALLFAFRSNTVLPYVVGAVIAEALMAWHVWPSRRVIARVQMRLDRRGGRSDLVGALTGS